MRNSLLKFATLLLAGASLSACSALDRLENIGEAPKLAAVGNPAGTQIVAEIPRPAPISHADNSLWQPGAQSFFHDPRAMHIGDVITVNVSVTDTAKLQNTTSRSRTNTENASMDNLFGLEKALPSPLDPSSLVKMGSDNSNVGVGSIQRAETISMTLAALVAQVLPNGNLVIQGRQEVRVNFEVRDLTISGIVRPEDISNSNEIKHTQIAEARISYGGRGQLTDVQQPRYGQQVVDILFPF